MFVNKLNDFKCNMIIARGNLYFEELILNNYTLFRMV